MAKKILIIEDEYDLSNALQVALVREGYEVSIADTGETGLRMLQETKPDLLLLDLFTHSIHGIHVLERVREDASIRDTKCIIITNIENDEHRKRALELGVIEYLVKAQVPLKDIVKKVNHSLTDQKVYPNL